MSSSLLPTPANLVVLRGRRRRDFWTDRVWYKHCSERSVAATDFSHSSVLGADYRSGRLSPDEVRNSNGRASRRILDEQILEEQDSAPRFVVMRSVADTLSLTGAVLSAAKYDSVHVPCPLFGMSHYGTVLVLGVGLD